MKSNLVTGKIGVHGESLGGSVASFIARKCNVDFVFVDRTFASLPAVAYWTFGGRIVDIIFRVFTRWNEECWLNYCLIGKQGEENKAYKLMGCDPDDKIVNELASMRNAVARYFS